jgi:hypothetical protein
MVFCRHCIRNSFSDVVSRDRLCIKYLRNELIIRFLLLWHLIRRDPHHDFLSIILVSSTMLSLSYLIWVTLISIGIAAPVQKSAGPPLVSVKNGTYAGVYSSVYDQDFFLGIPYAQPPIGDLRFRNPQSLNSTWPGEYHAQDYSFEVRLNILPYILYQINH